jgi:hypothetical protein
VKYYGLALQPMQESGAFLLRAMQNEDMPRLDLLVRESVQNALDAALNRQSGGEVRVDFHVRTHATETVASLLAEGLNLKVLRLRYPKGGRLLEIRDSLTEGLTGPLSFEAIGESRVHGNLLKLVFEIGRTRSDDGAGGSWGLGKTCYFRMGAGLVFYYSRIKLEDGFQERLVVSLVEDETRDDRLQQETRTGIAWWAAESALQPLTRTSQVHRVLEMFGIRPFTGTETGTSIIIPFLRDDLLPAEEIDEKGVAVRRPWWCSSYESYIKIAIGRWFCARLDNVKFATGPRLTATVNGTVVKCTDMLPVFQATQALYNRAVQELPDNVDYLTLKNVAPASILRRAVSPRNIFSSAGPAGYVTGALLTPEQLGMREPDNGPDPAMCVFGQSDTTPPYRPLVTFMRRPGMCVSWDDSTEGRGWAGGLPGVPDGHYLIAVFVPRHEQVLVPDGRRMQESMPVTLESYLRSCERADHATWHDISGLKVVEKIRSNCGKILREFGSKPAPVAASTQAIRMARNLADLVLPERGMGADGRAGKITVLKPSTPGAGRGRPGPSVPALTVSDIEYTNAALVVHWSLTWGAVDHSIPRLITVCVDSESGPIRSDEWKSEGLGSFPFHVTNFQLDPDSHAFATYRVRDDESGVVLQNRNASGIENVKGILHIKFVTDAAKALRAVLVADLSDNIRGHG